jgi:hypothetical protein
MVEGIHYRILSPDGSLSDDTFVTAPDQPENIKSDCLLVIDDVTGRRLTVHGTRLFPAAQGGLPPVRTASPSRCLKCGRVSGVVEDEVVCTAEHDAAACLFVQPRTE